MSDVERTPAGLQMVLPGCERRTLPKSTSRVDEGGQGLLHFYQPPSLREQLETRSEIPLRSNKGQRAMPTKWFVWLLRAVDWHYRSCWGYHSYWFLKASKMTLFPNDLLTMACNRAGGALRPPRYLGLNHDQIDAA